MGEYADYPRYKPSNVDWLGDIPEHWHNQKLKYTTNTATGFAFSSDDYISYGIPLIRISDVLDNGCVSIENAKRLPFDHAANFPDLLIKKNTILMAMTGATIGKSAKYLFDEPSLLNQRVCKFFPVEINQDYLWYILNSKPYFEHIKITCFGGAQPNISDKQLVEFFSTYPPLSEQKTIARFLDFKTAQIDALIAKKKMLLDKLAEKRTALISHAVTKGIDPSAPMKDSGVAWLGKIPAHWDTKRLRFCIKTSPSKIEIKLNHDALVSFVPMEAVGKFGGLNLDCEKELGDIGSGYTYFANNDVVVAKITPCFENGKGAIASGLKNGIAFGTTELHVMRSVDVLLPDYLFHITMSHSFRNIGEAEMYGAGGQKRVPETFIKNFQIGLPPAHEQKNILDYINKINQKIDLQMSKLMDIINGLTEYRSALITNAVTGKIDVRQFSVPSASTTEELAHA